MKLELNNFIKAAAAGDQSKYKARRDTLIEEFCEYLGFKRWNTPSIRPDCDPKWDYFKWSGRDRGYVDNVRVMSFKHMYAESAMTVAKRNDSTYPNGWKVADVIETLMQLRREYKAGMFMQLRREYKAGMLMKSHDTHNISGSEYNEWQKVAKYLLNITYSIFCRFGTKNIGFGSHDIVAEARRNMMFAITRIQQSGGLVLAAYNDEIVYYGEQANVFNVHHEKFNKFVFGQHNSYSYGNDIRVMMQPRIMLDMEGWEPGHGIGSVESQRERRVLSVAKTRKFMEKSLADYMNKTKEDVEKEFVDLWGE